MKKTYTIVAGVNGSGKSSFIGMLKNERNDLGQIINVDEITKYEAGGKVLEGGKIALKRIRECLKNNFNFTQETTLSGNQAKKTILQAKKQGYQIRLYYIALSEKYESIIRIRNRVLKGGHDIPETDVERRFNKRFKDLLEVIPLCDEVSLYDNDNGFEEIAVITDGELITRSKMEPKWLKEFTTVYEETTLERQEWDEEI